VTFDASGHSQVLSGAVELKLGDVTLNGTVLEGQSGVHAGRGGVHVVGGAGHLKDVLAARAYGTIPLRVLLQDLAKESGETLAPETALWARSLTRWTRPAVTMAQALNQVLAPLGGVWRVLDDGTVWVGEESWPEVNQRRTDVVLDELPGSGLFVLAPESPWLRPCVTFRGRRVCHVTYEVSPKGVRASLYLDEGRGLSDLVRTLVRETLRTELLALGLYQARVVKQAANGSIEVQPDSPLVPPLVGVQLKLPWPGCRVTVSAGDRVLVGFEGGDLTKPYAVALTAGSGQEVNLDVDGADRGVARIDDTADCGRLYYQPHPTYPGSVWLLPPGSSTWQNCTGPPVPPTLPTQGVEIDAVIETGSDKVTA